MSDHTTRNTFLTPLHAYSIEHPLECSSCGFKTCIINTHKGFILSIRCVDCGYVDRFEGETYIRPSWIPKYPSDADTDIRSWYIEALKGLSVFTRDNGIQIIDQLWISLLNYPTLFKFETGVEAPLTSVYGPSECIYPRRPTAEEVYDLLSTDAT